MKELKYTLLLSFFFLHLALLAQNPVTQEISYRYTNDKTWRKVSTIDFDYQGNRLFKETQRSYNDILEDWFISAEKWFDVDNNIVREITRNFISLNSGFYIRDNQYTYSDSGQLLLTLLSIKESKDEPFKLVNKIETEYIDDCSYVERLYYTNSDSDELIFGRIQLALYDEVCQFARFVSSFEIETTVETLRNNIRVSYEPLPNGRRRRIVEETVCPPEVTNCQEWDIKEQLIFDANGRNIVREIGSRNDFFRTLTTIEYEPTQTVYEFRTFIKLNGINQVLTGVEREVLDLAEKPLSRKRAEPSILEEWTYVYNENELIEQEIYVQDLKGENDVQTFSDTTNYTYLFYCDGLPSEVIEENADRKNRTTYSYQNPTDCGTNLTELSPFVLFPNPATNFMTVANGQFVDATLTISIIDAYGRIVQTQQNDRNVYQVINLTQLSSGVYYLQINNSKDVISEPFIINK